MRTSTGGWRRAVFAALMAAGLSAAGGTGAQTLAPLTSQWAPGVVASPGGIVIPPFPIVSGEPFKANNDLRRIEVRNGTQIVYEGHSVIARDSAGRIATQTAESPHTSMPGAPESSFSFVPAGGTIVDPATMVHMAWNGGGPPQMDKVVMKNRLLPNQSRPAPLDACERENGHTRTYLTGVTQQIEEIGERTIQGIETRGCRVTTITPAAVAHSDQPVTTVQETWSSPVLRVTLLRTNRGWNGMEEVDQLDDIVLGEPDPSLFERPFGYAIRDMDAERAQQEQAEFVVAPGEADAATLAGNWEATDPFTGEGSEVGILLKIQANRRVPFDHGRVTGSGPQKFSDFEIRVYQRTGGKDTGGWFTTGPHGGTATWDGHRLQLSFTGTPGGGFVHGQLGLDLTFDTSKKTWSGTYTRDGKAAAVLLTRPGRGGGGGGKSVRGRMAGRGPARRIEWRLRLHRARDGWNGGGLAERGRRTND